MKHPVVQDILFEINCTIFYTNLHELFCQFISWTNWVDSGKIMDNCWISCQVIADMKKVYDDLIIINLYIFYTFDFFSYTPCYLNIFYQDIFISGSPYRRRTIQLGISEHTFNLHRPWGRVIRNSSFRFRFLSGSNKVRTKSQLFTLWWRWTTI